MRKVDVFYKFTNIPKTSNYYIISAQQTIYIDALSSNQ